ncbi:MAG TPA: DUF507 family protein [Polyangiaceae bacterium]
MRLSSAKIPAMAAEMVSLLTSAGDIETSSPREVQADLESVLGQYVRDESEVNEKAKELLAARGLPPTEFAKLKKLVAGDRKIKLGDDAIDYLLDQLVEMLMYSQHVDEVFAEDVQLRLRMRTPLRKAAADELKLQEAVRGQLKHVEEGTAIWEVEYQRMMDDIRRRKGL